MSEGGGHFGTILAATHVSAGAVVDGLWVNDFGWLAVSEFSGVPRRLLTLNSIVSGAILVLIAVAKAVIKVVR